MLSNGFSGLTEVMEILHSQKPDRILRLLLQMSRRYWWAPGPNRMPLGFIKKKLALPEPGFLEYQRLPQTRDRMLVIEGALRNAAAPLGTLKLLNCGIKYHQRLCPCNSKVVPLGVTEVPTGICVT